MPRSVCRVPRFVPAAPFFGVEEYRKKRRGMAKDRRLSTGSDGRKLFSESALLNPAGDPAAIARSTWLRLD